MLAALDLLLLAIFVLCSVELLRPRKGASFVLARTPAFHAFEQTGDQGKR